MEGNKDKPMVCIVDDDASVRKGLGRLMGSVGLEVETFTTAEEFLKRSRSRGACLILDVHLPGMGGFELQDQLFANRDALPIIFITGHYSENEKKKATAVGAIAYMEKPFEDKNLLEAINKALTTGKGARGTYGA